MFYNEKIVLAYPTKDILNDAVSRSYNHDNEAYSPIRGEIYEQLQGYKDKVGFDSVDVLRYPNSINHLDIRADKLIDKIDAKDNLGIGIDEVMHLDEKVIELILEYNANCLYGYFYHDIAGVRSKREQGEDGLETYITFKDNSDSDIKKSASDLLEEDRDTEIEEVEKRRLIEKLCYYIKLIDQCSIFKELNIMQIIFLTAKYGDNQKIICSQGIEKIDRDGRVVSVYAESFNSNQKWIEFWTWYTQPKEKWDQWNKIIHRFLDIVDKLKIDLKNPNDSYKRYTTDFANSVVCTYIASNEEVTDLFGFPIDPNVSTLLEPEELFKMKSKLTGFDRDWLENNTDSKFINAYRIKIEKARELESDEWKQYQASKTKKKKKKNEPEFEEINFAIEHSPDYDVFISLYINQLRIVAHDTSIQPPTEYDSYGLIMINDKVTTELRPVKITNKLLSMVLGFRYNLPEFIYITRSGLAISASGSDLTTFRCCRLSDVVRACTSGGTNHEFPTMQAISCL